MGTTTLTLTCHIPPWATVGTVYPNVATVTTTSVDPNSENDGSATDLEVGAIVEGEALGVKSRRACFFGICNVVALRPRGQDQQPDSPLSLLA